VTAVLALFLLMLTVPAFLDSFQPLFVRWGLPSLARGSSRLTWLHERAAPFHLANPYGLFRDLTEERPEIIVEGSDDGREWKAYEFRYKPGALAGRPRFVAPHQPRLDWQMWFAALGRQGVERWFAMFCLRLLEGSPPVLDLLAANPFPERPPRYVRALLHDYRFTTREERAATGDWWQRSPLRQYLRPVTREELQAVLGR
jgi:hypothetical protein